MNVVSLGTLNPAQSSIVNALQGISKIAAGVRCTVLALIIRVDLQLLGNVLARAIKLVPAIRLNGDQRILADLGLFVFVLEQRRLRGLFIETFNPLVSEFFFSSFFGT